MPLRKINDQIGICIKDQTGRVEFQNIKCIDICGNQKDQVCSNGCMRAEYNRNENNKLFNCEMSLHKNIEINGSLIDAALVPSSKQLTTFLITKDDQIIERLSELKFYNLSPMENSVMEMYLIGVSNKSIAKKLFISLPTLRTHLNNIYKKIPIELKIKITNIKKSI